MKKSKVTPKSKKKPKYNFGATLEEYKKPIAQGSMLAGQLISNADPSSSVGSAAGGALEGLSAGAGFGPAGMIGGAVIGAGLGLAGAESEKRRIKSANKQKEELVTRNLMNNAGAALAEGGQINNIPEKLKVIKGGALQPISRDAVEVHANNPQETDSVELKDAYVDDKEIIDKENRVFSAELGFAKRAKKLEKQKTKDSRFSDANGRIDEKLDSLFEEQENAKEHMKAGGKIKLMKGGKLRLTGPFPMRLLDEKDQFVLGGVKGGDTDDPNKERRSRAMNLTGYDIPLPELKSVDPYSFNSQKKRIGMDVNSKKIGNVQANMDQGLTNLATFAPNVVSAVAQKRLVGPASPQLERTIGLKRISPDAQLSEADVQANQANQIIKGNTAQAGDIASATGSILAKKLQAKNQIYGQNQSINAQIQHQEAGLNVGIGARNAERVSEYSQGLNDFSNLQQKLTSENVANLSSKVLQQGREKKQMQLDKDKERIRSFGYRDSGVYDRFRKDFEQEDPEAYKRVFGKAKGGIIGIDQNPDDYDFNGELKRGRIYGGELEYNSRGGKINYQLGGGGDGEVKTTQPVSPNDFKRISWKSQGLMDSTSHGPLYETTYNALNRLNKTVIPQGVDPNSQTYVENPLGLQALLNKKVKASPALNIAGEVSNEQGALAHFKKGGRLKEKSKDMRSIPEMTDPEILSQNLAKGGSIHINPKNRGKFNALKKRTGKTTEQLKHSKNPLTRKRAVFAANAKKWHHEEGGYLGDPRHIDQDTPSGQLGARARLTMDNIDNVNQRKRSRRRKEKVRD